MWLRESGQEVPVAELGRLSRVFDAPHMRELLLAAVATAYCAGVEPALIAERAPGLEGLPHRMERCRDGQVRCINDSAATTPESTICALDALAGERVVLIAGGGGAKRRNFRELATRIEERAFGCVVFEDDEVGRQLREYLPTSFPLRRCASRDMAGAVHAAHRLLADQEGTVLLSPGCKGGPTFADMYERGTRFREAVQGEGA